MLAPIFLPFSPGDWIVTGDPGNTDDVIVIRQDPLAAGTLQAEVNGSVQSTQPASSLRQITVWAGAGDDTVRIDLPASLANVPTTVYGGPGNDWLVGGPGPDVLLGGGGRDTLEGRGGADQLRGGPGNDRLRGGNGPDVLAGNRGRDTLEGELGADDLYGGYGGDWLDGGAGADRLFGQRGSDVLDGQEGDDRLAGGPHHDQLDGGDGDDRAYGGQGRDVVRGGSGVNLLAGGAGADWIYGLPERDQIPVEPHDLLIEDGGETPLRALGSPEEFRQWLLAQGRQALREVGGNPWWYRSSGWIEPIAVLEAGGPAIRVADVLFGEVAVDAATAAAVPDFSQTNTQEAGVDESDLLKTDGEYIYLVSNQELVIVDAWPAADIHVVSRTPLENYGAALYLHGDRLVVIEQDYGFFIQPRIALAADGWWPTYDPQVTVRVLDVTDPAAPTLVEETRLDGHLVNSRAIDGRVYVVTQADFHLLQPQWDFDPDTGRMVPESPDDYLARLAATDVDQQLPHFTTVDASGNVLAEDLVGGFPDFFVPDVYSPQADILSVSLLDVTDDQVPGVESSVSVVGLSGEVYASTESLYVTATRAPWWWGRGGLESTVYKFELGAEGISVAASGRVPGRILNQFSMDEEDGFLRIATTTGWGRDAANHVFVLGQSADSLVTVGSVQDLAPSETIQAVRFLGDWGFVVTFERVDPLFTLDLSDPRQPRLVGELEIPGFSSYLQPLGDHHLIGLGRNADETTGQVLGLQLSLFDVSDLAHPRRTDVFQFPGDGWGGYSEAEYDFKALSLFPEPGILALPVQAGDWWDWQPASLQVFRVDTASGFELLGEIQHTQEVRRSFRIEDYLYSYSANEIQVHVIDAPQQQVAQLDIQPETNDQVIWPVPQGDPNVALAIE